MILSTGIGFCFLLSLNLDHIYHISIIDSSASETGGQRSREVLVLRNTICSSQATLLPKCPSMLMNIAKELLCDAKTFYPSLQHLLLVPKSLYENEGV